MIDDSQRNLLAQIASLYYEQELDSATLPINLPKNWAAKCCTCRRPYGR
jgi:hypothetical protein